MNPFHRIPIVIVAALALCACSKSKSSGGTSTDAGPSAFTAYTSGARLRAEVWDVDGVRALHGWYDAARGEECAFERPGNASDKHYCLPTDSDDVTTFTDAACTQPVHVVFGAPKSYAIVRPTNACAGQPSVYQHGDALPVTQWYSRNNGACLPQSGKPTAVYALDAVPLDAFAGAHEVVENRGRRIASLVLATDDGAREVVAGYDQDRHEASWVPAPNWLGIPGPSWMPARFAWSWSGHLTVFFSDPACQSAVAADYDPKMAQCPLTAVMGDLPVRSAGAMVDATGVYLRDQDGGCSSISGLGQDYLYVTLGDPIPQAAFAPAATVKIGSGRIKLAFDADGTSPVAPPTNSTLGNPGPGRPPFMDDTWGEPCELHATADGITRCVPLVTAQLVYADAACTQLAMQLQSESPLPRAAVLTLQDGLHVTVRAVGAKIADQAYTRSGADCHAGQVGPCHALGDEMDAQFEAVADVRE